jgi:hypothetical protein
LKTLIDFVFKGIFKVTFLWFRGIFKVTFFVIQRDFQSDVFRDSEGFSNWRFSFIRSSLHHQRDSPRIPTGGDRHHLVSNEIRVLSSRSSGWLSVFLGVLFVLLCWFSAFLFSPNVKHYLVSLEHHLHRSVILNLWWSEMKPEHKISLML